MGWLTWPWTEDARPTVPRLGNPVQLTSAVGVEDFPTWSPDGRTLAFEGSGDIWVTTVDGGQPVNRTADYGGRDAVPSWSPEGSQIAFWSERDGGGYFVMSALGGAARKVISASSSRSPPLWSVDGKELACFDADEVLRIVHIDTRESRELSLPGKTIRRWDPSWSPDGSSVAYIDAVARTSYTTWLRIFRPADEQALVLTEGRTGVWSPSWSTDGRKLFLISNRGGSMDLWQWVLRSNRSPEGDPQPVTAGIEMRRAAFSPDGSKLAYARGRPVANLWRVPIRKDRPATWADAEQLTFDQANIDGASVLVSGERVVFTSDRGGYYDLWTFSVDGGELTQVTSDDALDQNPQWSPDGTEIAFHSDRSGRREIWVIPVSGGPARQLTYGEGTDTASYQPTWSSDGREIAFVADEGGDVEIHVIPSAGGEARAVTSRTEESWQPDWSPDGEWLLLQSGELVRAAGGDPVAFTEADGAVWSSDGRRAFFYRPGERAGNLWEIVVESRAERQMTDFVGRPGTMGAICLTADTRYLYFCWQEDLGDIWVMDVVTDEDS